MYERLTPGTERISKHGNHADYMNRVAPFVQHAVFSPNVLSEGAYSDVIQKPSVVMLGNLPCLIGLEDSENFVHTERCKIIAQQIGGGQQSDIYVSLLPPPLLVESLGIILPRRTNEKGLIIFAEVDVLSPQSDSELRKVLEMLELSLHYPEHPRLRTQASLNLFEINIEVATDNNSRFLSLVEATELKFKEPRKMDDGEIIFSKGGDLTEDDMKALWELFSQRFAGISDNLPTRLEETEGTTRQILSDPHNVFVCKKGLKGEVLACILATDDTDSYPWINPLFIAYRNQQLTRNGQQPYPVFAPGIASQGKKGSGSATQVLEGLTDLLVATNRPNLAVRFECTDVSSTYMPGLSMKAVRAQPGFERSEIQQVAQKKYVVIKT